MIVSASASPRTLPTFTGRDTYVLHAGMGHVPTEVAPDLRSRSYLIEAFVELKGGDCGVLIAHGDATSGYSLYIRTVGSCTLNDLFIGAVFLALPQSWVNRIAHGTSAPGS